MTGVIIFELLLLALLIFWLPLLPFVVVVVFTSAAILPTRSIGEVMCDDMVVVLLLSGVNGEDEDGCRRSSTTGGC